MKVRSIPTKIFVLLVFYFHSVRAQNAPLSWALAGEPATPVQAVDLQNAITELPVPSVREHMIMWIDAALNGTHAQSLNSSMAILCVAMRVDGWELLSPWYSKTLSLLNSPYADVQQRELFIALHDGIFAKSLTAAALQSYITHGSLSERSAHDADEVRERASSVQMLVQLAPSDPSTREALRAILRQNLSVDDRMLIIQGLGSQTPIDRNTLDILVATLDSPSAPLRETAVRALDHLDRTGNAVFGRVGAKLLQMSVEDSDAAVRKASQESLKHMAGDRPPPSSSFK